MKILFISSVLPERAEAELKYISNAANRFDINIIKALQKVGHEITVCSFVGYEVPPFFFDNPINGISEKEFYYFKSKGLSHEIVSFRNKYRELVMDNDFVLCDNCGYGWYGIGKTISKKHKANAVIVGDYSDEKCFAKEKGLRKIKKIIFAKLQRNNFRQFNKVIGLSEEIRKYIKDGQKFVLMEGGINFDQWQYEPADVVSDEIRLMYSGQLSRVQGVDLAVDSFLNIAGPKEKLYISGAGDLENWVKEQADNNSNIVFCGKMPYEEYISCLKQADILLNPRNMNFRENINNFPSKMLEYLAIGKVIVSTKFSGWEKFSDNAYYADSTVESFSLTLRKALNEFDQRKKDFFIKNQETARNFDWVNQVERIIKE